MRPQQQRPPHRFPDLPTKSDERIPARPESDIFWFRRSAFVRAAAAWIATGGMAGAVAQQRGNIVELAGDVQRNGAPLRAGDTVLTGDVVETGPGSSLVFIIGGDAFRLRAGTRMAVDRGSSINAVSVLRLVTGGLVAAWSPGTRRAISTSTVIAGIRGTGTYAQVFAAGDGADAERTYFCNCYGTVDLDASGERLTSQADYHQSFWADAVARPGMAGPLRPAKMVNHTDEELEALAALVDQRTAWQISGRKGSLDGMGGYMGDPVPAHPAAVSPPVR